MLINIVKNFRIFFIFVLVFSLSSCTTTVSKNQDAPQSDLNKKRGEKAKINIPAKQNTSVIQYRAVRDPLNRQESYMKTRAELSGVRAGLAYAKVRNYLEKHPDGQFADDAAFLLSRREFQEGRYSEAARLAYKVTQFDPPSKLRGKSIFLYAQSFYALNKKEEAVNSLANIKLQEIPGDSRGELFRFWARASLESGKYFESVLSLLKVYHSYPGTGNERLRDKRKIEELIDKNLEQSELEALLNEYADYNFPSYPVQLRLARIYMAKGKRDDALAFISNILRKAPNNSEYYFKAQSLQKRAEAANSSASKRFGVLVPLTGRMASWGKSLKEGIDLALSRDNPGQIEVVYADSGSRPETAMKALQRLAFEENIMAVVGPFSGKQAEVLTDEVVDFALPFISLSPRSGLLEKSDLIFRMAVTPEKQVKALVDHARSRYGARRFAILFPEDKFGASFANAYFKVVKDQGGSITAAESYDPKRADFRALLRNMVGTAFPHFRREEFNDLKDNFKTRYKRNPTPKEIRKLKLEAIVDFDVLFLPDTYRSVGQIVPSLLYEDIDIPVIMGPATWNNKRLISRAGPYLKKAFFVDSYSRKRRGSVASRFLNAFQMRYNRLPGPVSALGFDTALAMKRAFSKGGVIPSSREELRLRFENLGAIDGVLGMQLWDENRDPIAELQIFDVSKNAFQYVKSVKIDN